jgi:apolipoprotein D and lipocalin family protein
MNNKKTWLMIAAGAGTASLAYALWPKKKVPFSAIIDHFDKNKYMGTWQEIARLPNAIEKNLTDLTEEYTLNEDNTIKVVTRAFNTAKNKLVEATGTIKFKGPENRGQLEVAYFLPIYLDYNILDVDRSYRFALVSGNGLNYLWLLSKENSIPEDIQARFLEKATALGFDTAKLEWMQRP